MSLSPDHCTVITQTLELIAENGVSNLDMCQIAQHLNCSVSDIHYYFPSKIRMLKTISIFLIDNQLKMLDPTISQLTMHDRLFEILISFCEANDHYKPAIYQIIHDLFYSPQLLLPLSIFWYTKYKEILQKFSICFSDNIKGHIKLNGLLLMISKFYHSWLMNRDGDINDLMHQLDKLLRLWEKYTDNLH